MQVTPPALALPSRWKNHLRTERQVHLTGAAAADWLGLSGWRAQAPHTSMRLYGDCVASGGFVLLRAWRTPGMLRSSVAPQDDDETVIFLLPVEGAIEVRGRSCGDVLVDTGQMVLLRTRHPFAVHSAEPVACIEVRTQMSRLAELSSRDIAPIELLTSPESASLLRIFTSMTTEMLNVTPSPEEASFYSLRLAVEALLSALLTRARATTSSIFMAAYRAIADQHTDPSFAMSTLHEQLGVSRATLYRAFAEEQTTPGKVLRELSRTRIGPLSRRASSFGSI